MSTSYHNGGIIQNVHVQLILWGSYWEGSNPNPSVEAIRVAISSIVTGTYMSSLSQYSSPSPYQYIGTGVLYGTTLVTSAVNTPNPSPADPPNPFSEHDITTLVSNLIYTNEVVSPSEPGAADNQVLYCVILPPTWTYKDNANFIGLHSSYVYYAPPLYWHIVRYAWVTQGPVGSLDAITSIFSHELAEACSDPDGTGWFLDPGPDQNEIGDLCPGVFNRLANGVLLQGYFSNSDNGCVVPTEKFVKDNKDGKDGADGKNAKDQKEAKDQHKERKEAKEKDRDFVQGEPWIKNVLAELASTTTEQQANGQAFIRPEERPAVGEHALTQAQDAQG